MFSYVIKRGNLPTFKTKPISEKFESKNCPHSDHNTEHVIHSIFRNEILDRIIQRLLSNSNSIYYIEIINSIIKKFPNQTINYINKVI